VAVRTSRKIVIEATPEAIMDALADVQAFPSYSPAYKRAEVLDRYEDNRPHHVRIAVKVLGIVDEEVLEYHWGPDWLVWDAECTTQQYAQHVEYTLRPDHTGNSTVVTVDITVEPDSLIPDFLIKRAGKDADRCGNRGAAQSSTARQVIAPKSTFCRKSASAGLQNVDFGAGVGGDSR
jgi:uncharacterized protein YndB with AHSA1/START domain